MTICACPICKMHHIQLGEVDEQVSIERMAKAIHGVSGLMIPWEAANDKTKTLPKVIAKAAYNALKEG
jgi:hypothetical protein